MRKKLNSFITASTEVTCSITRGSTGRKTSFNTQEDIENECIVKDWIAQESSEKFGKHLAAGKFREFIRTNPGVTTNPIICYRGRYLTNDMRPKPLRLNFGPPLDPLTKSGRYNIKGKSVLYLATSKEGVALEMKGDDMTIINLWCQEFLIPGRELRLADFSLLELNNFIHMVFDYSEHGLRTGAVNKRDYVFSQIIAEIVQDEGFDGMLVPGVRGNPDDRYCNIIIFNPEEKWKNWFNKTAQPECIDSILDKI